MAYPQGNWYENTGHGRCSRRREWRVIGTKDSAGPAVTAPFMIRLTWNHGEVIASTSADGKTWKETGRALVAFTGPILPGLCLSGHQAQETVAASFDQVRIEALPSR